MGSKSLLFFVNVLWFVICLLELGFRCSDKQTVLRLSCVKHTSKPISLKLQLLSWRFVLSVPTCLKCVAGVKFRIFAKIYRCTTMNENDEMQYILSVHSVFICSDCQKWLENYDIIFYDWFTNIFVIILFIIFQYFHKSSYIFGALHCLYLMCLHISRSWNYPLHSWVAISMSCVFMSHGQSLARSLLSSLSTPWNASSS